MPVRVDNYQELSEEELERRPEPEPQIKAEPVWEEHLDKLARGITQRIPVESQNVRGLRLALGRRASKRGSLWTQRAHRTEVAT
jgi:hypothetical protein